GILAAREDLRLWHAGHVEAAEFGLVVVAADGMERLPHPAERGLADELVAARALLPELRTGLTARFLRRRRRRWSVGRGGRLRLTGRGGRRDGGHDRRPAASLGEDTIVL